MAVLVVGLWGCDGTLEFPRTVAYDDRFTDAELRVVEGAVGEWSDATGVVDIELVPEQMENDLERILEEESDWIVKLPINSEEEVQAEALLANMNDSPGMPSAAHLYDPNTQVIVVFEARIHDADSLRSILLHELGHYFGLDHDEHDPNLMHPKLSGTTPYVDDRTLRGFCALYDCR